MLTVSIAFEQPVLINGEKVWDYFFPEATESKSYDIGSGIYQVITSDGRVYCFPLHTVRSVETTVEYD